MIKINNRAFLLSNVSLYARDNKAGWKLDADGKIEMDANGNPIYLQSDGREMIVEANTISTLNAEAKTNRERFQQAENKLKVFEGIDPEKAKGALAKLADLDAGKLIENGELERVKSQITEQFTGQLNETKTALEKLVGENKNLRLDAAFSSSKFMEKFAVPADMVRAQFGRHFEVDDDGKITAKGYDGNPVYSRARMGEIATFDEALEALVEQYPGKDKILKAPEAHGSGNQGQGGGRPGSKRTIKRAEFDAMTPGDQQQVNVAMGKGEAALVD